MIELSLQDCLEDVIDNRGVTPHKRGTEWQSEGVPVLSANNVKTSGLQKLDEIRYIPEEVYPVWMKMPLEKGDIILTSEAPAGEVYYWDSEDVVALGQRLYGLKVKKQINSLFLKYYLQSSVGQKAIAGQQSGSTVFGIAAATFPHIMIKLPDREDQDRMANLLYTIDKKINNNNALSFTLESLAKTLYDYWFVQFDFPDENGKPYKSSGGKMVWNEELKREIPEGWEVRCLADLISQSKNGEWGNETTMRDDDIEVKCFRGADFASITSDYNVTAPTRFISSKNQDRLLADGDLVTEISGGSPTQATGRIGYISQKFLERNESKMTCSNFCKAFSPVNKKSQYWLYHVWKALYDAGVMFNYESKTTGIKNLMFDEFIKWNKVPVPPVKLLKDYQDLCSMYYNKTQDLFIESSKLASLRDVLLPMLMNGQVKVSE